MLLINISGFIILKKWINNNEKLERGSFIKINQSQYSTSKCKEREKDRKKNKQYYEFDYFAQGHHILTYLFFFPISSQSIHRQIN